MFDQRSNAPPGGDEPDDDCAQSAVLVSPCGPGLDDPVPVEDRERLDRIIHDLYVKLKPLARRLSSPRMNPTLNATALLNEACIRVLSSRGLSSKRSDEIIRIFAHVMRQILVDRARYKLSAKRGGGVIHIPLNPGDPLAPDPASPAHPVPVETVLTLEKAVIELERVSARQARIVECRVYLGCTADETALLLGVAKTTVEREYRKATEFLNAHIEPKRS